MIKAEQGFGGICLKEAVCPSVRKLVYWGSLGWGIAAMFMKRTLKLEVGLASVETRTGQIRWLWSGADAIMQDGLDNCWMPGANFAREFVSHCSGAAIRRALIRHDP